MHLVVFIEVTKKASEKSMLDGMGHFLSGHRLDSAQSRLFWLSFCADDRSHFLPRLFFIILCS
jgi:hypothetical protein